MTDRPDSYRTARITSTVALNGEPTIIGSLCLVTAHLANWRLRHLHHHIATEIAGAGAERKPPPDQDP
jgi:hypothetical protein